MEIPQSNSKASHRISLAAVLSQLSHDVRVCRGGGHQNQDRLIAAFDSSDVLAQEGYGNGYMWQYTRAGTQSGSHVYKGLLETKIAHPDRIRQAAGGSQSISSWMQHI